MIGQSADKNFAYILGVYLGDGCVTYTGSIETKTFRLNTIDRDFAEAAAAALLALTGTKPNVRTYPVKRGKDDNQLGIADQALCAKLVDDTEYKKHIPAYVFSWARDLKIAFIAGLMDSEGFVAANTGNPTNRRYYMGFKCCSEWVPKFVELLQSVGVNVGKVSTEEPRKLGYKAPIRFTIKMQSWIDAGCYFNIQRKQKRVLEWAEAGAYERRARHPRRLISETTREAAE